PDPCGACDRSGGRAESADRRLRTATPGRLRHAGRRYRGRAGPHPRRSGAGPHRAHGGYPPARRPPARGAAPANRPSRRACRAGSGGRAGRPWAAAYCVAGPHPTVILTTAALQTLDPDQLDAVLAHERAHLASHDHRLLAIARIGRQVLPFLPLMRDADTQITRLVEMHADDAATTGRDAGPLATALVVLATASGPAPGLAAAATDAVQRIQRLLRPAEPLSLIRRQLLRA